MSNLHGRKCSHQEVYFTKGCFSHCHKLSLQTPQWIIASVAVVEQLLGRTLVIDFKQNIHRMISCNDVEARFQGFEIYFWCFWKRLDSVAIKSLRVSLVVLSFVFPLIKVCRVGFNYFQIRLVLKIGANTRMWRTISSVSLSVSKHFLRFPLCVRFCSLSSVSDGAEVTSLIFDYNNVVWLYCARVFQRMFMLCLCYFQLKTTPIGRWLVHRNRFLIKRRFI